MFSFALIAGWLCVATWVYLATAHGRFWRIVPAQLAPRKPKRLRNQTTTPAIAVVIPARNEADMIGKAVTSLLAQAGGANIVRIFVVDDSSSDGTAETASAASLSLVSAGAPFSPQARDRRSSSSLGDRMKGAASNRVAVIAAGALAPGWTGKLWAMQQGIEQALRLHPDYLLLTDADIEHAPGSLAALVSSAEVDGYDLASVMVKLHCRSVAEKLLIPAFVFFFFMLYPPEWVRDARRRTAGAAGGCMLVRPAALERIGGIAAIRGEVIDDCALARAVKRSGGKVWLGATRETRSLRPYESFGAVERMIARTAFNQLHHSAWLLLGTVLGMLLLYVLPLALIVSGSPRLAIAGAFACGLMTFVYLSMVRFYRLNPLWALALPIAAGFYTAATIHSAVKYWTGRGGEWKGRAQDVSR
ncbi:MAG TPA: glycosyltransferase [Terriglobales bacterium]|nr:glycosyltransferase [Terriglobales bacterium]